MRSTPSAPTSPPACRCDRLSARLQLASRPQAGSKDKGQPEGWPLLFLAGVPSRTLSRRGEISQYLAGEAVCGARAARGTTRVGPEARQSNAQTGDWARTTDDGASALAT